MKTIRSILDTYRQAWDAFIRDREAKAQDKELAEKVTKELVENKKGESRQ